MPPVIAAAGGFATAITGGAIAFGAPTAAFAAGVSLATFATSTAGTLLISGAFILGSQLLSQNAAKSGGINAPEVRGSIKQATPPQRVIYGYARVGGPLFYHNDSAPPALVWGLLLSRRRVTSVEQVTVGVIPVPFDADGASTIEPFKQSSANNRLFMSFRDGDPDQAIDPLILAADPGIDADFRQRGHATVVFKALYGDDIDDFQAMWGQGVSIPNILLDVAGAPVFDPRDPLQDVDDETTWQFTNCGALVQADWLRQPYGGRLMSSQLRWDEIGAAANYDDELVALKSGEFQKRYTIDGVITLNQQRDGIIENMLTANRGFVAGDQGRVWVTSSTPQAPVATITDALMRGGIVYRETARKNSILNRVRSRFVDPDRDYQIVDGPVRTDDDLVIEDGQILETTLGLNFTRTHPRAQRLADLTIKESRLQRQIVTNLPTRRALGFRVGQVLRVESDIMPRMNGLYRIEARGYNADFSMMAVTLAEYDGTLAAQWIAADDERDFTLAEI